jgi:hypothetical protein
MSPIRLTGAAVAALALAACADQPVALRTPSGVPGANQGSRPPLVSNAVKYRDAGAKPAVSRSGAASLTVSALLDRAGVTHLDVTSGTAANPGSGAGTLDQVQVKFIPGDSVEPTVQNFHQLGTGHFTYEFAGFTRGVPVQVRAAISGIEPNRTDVVTVSDQVRLAPDPAVTSLDMPYYAPYNTAVTIMATIRELNGDVGARADCVLYVQGVAVDRAPGIWVDAGGTVSCAFRHTFAAAGGHDVAVALENVSPADYDTGNNRLQRWIGIEPPATFYGGVSAEDLSYDNSVHDSVVYNYPDGSRFETSTRTSQAGRAQRFYLTAGLQKRLTYPIDRIRLRYASGGVTFSDTTLLNASPDPSTPSGCVTVEYTSYTAGRLELCVQAWEFTTATWTRSAGDVVYHSVGYSASFDPSGAVTYGPVYNVVHEQLAEPRPLEPWGSVVDVQMVVEDDGVTYDNIAHVPLSPYELIIPDPYAGCFSYDYGWALIYRCSEQRTSVTGMQGFANFTRPPY